MKKDWLLFIDVLLITAIGLTTLYSTVIGSEHILGGGGMVNRQLLLVLLGLVLYFVFAVFDYSILGVSHIIIPVTCIGIILLVLVLAFGEEVNNARRWLLIASVQVQPSEFIKIILIIFTAWAYSMRNTMSIWVLSAITAGVSLVSSILIFIQPDASTAILILLVWACMSFYILPNQGRNSVLLIIAVLSALSANYTILERYNELAVSLGILGIVSGLYVLIRSNIRMLVLIAIITGILLGISGRAVWDNVLADYQKQRIESFLDPASDIQGSGFQVDQSKVAIGSGLLFGKGFGHGSQSKLHFLPEHQTDFIFATFAEEFGLVGVIVVLVLFCFAILRIISIASLTTDTFGSLIAIGIGSKLLIEVFINIAMNMGIVPATGVPLPLMSIGGSILISTFIGLGIVQSVMIHRSEIDAMKSL